MAGTMTINVVLGTIGITNNIGEGRRMAIIVTDSATRQSKKLGIAKIRDMGCLGILGNLVNMGKLGSLGGLGKMCKQRSQDSLADPVTSSPAVSPASTFATLPNGHKCVILEMLKDDRVLVRQMNTTTISNIEFSRLLPY